MICKVVKSDAKKGNTDINKKEVSVQAAAAKEEEFARAKELHILMWQVARKNGIAVEDLCEKVSWPLFRQHRDPYSLLRRHLMKEVDVWKDVDFSKPGKNLSGKLAVKLKADIEDCLRKRLGQRRLNLRAKVEVACPEMDGIDHVRQALLSGSKVSKPECELTIKLIVHPLFAITCICLDRELGISAIDESMERIERSIRANGGTFRVRSHPERPDDELVSDLEEEEFEDELEDEEGTSGAAAESGSAAGGGSG